MSSGTTGRVEALYTAPGKGEPMVTHDAVVVKPGGIEGDRYFDGTGYYSATDGCQVTLVDAAVLEDARETFDVDLSNGAHRRNVVVSGIDPADLLDSTFTLGEATLRGTRLRPPCAYLAGLIDDEDVIEALREQRGGICAEVVESGRVTVGSGLTITEANPREMGKAIAARLGEEPKVEE
ncbi:MOSC domain-containing protein [Haloferax namakaokahaiae]|uniref:MOSC domain-containing protein n=1 Tax=Haloferax namakaokahaiae TaxID=1748331 RepID=A0ABD5ZFG4_9EURY